MAQSAPSLLQDIQHFCKTKFTERSDYHLGKACVKRRNRSTMITKAHIIYALLLYQYSGYRCFKWFYFKEMLGHSAPVRWPSYSWFLRLKKRVIGELFAYLKSQNIRKTGVYYIDASALEVCHNKRISQHKTGLVLEKWRDFFAVKRPLSRIGSGLENQLSSVTAQDCKIH